MYCVKGSIRVSFAAIRISHGTSPASTLIGWPHCNVCQNYTIVHLFIVQVVLFVLKIFHSEKCSGPLSPLHVLQLLSPVFVILDQCSFSLLCPLNSWFMTLRVCLLLSPMHILYPGLLKMSWIILFFSELIYWFCLGTIFHQQDNFFWTIFLSLS